jgi:predicted nucleic acid-binding protein
VGELTNLIAGKLVAFDTAPLIYYIEEHPHYLSLVDELFNAFDTGEALGITSVLTLHEVLIQPLRDGAQDITAKYREVLTNSANVTIYPVDVPICETAARLRANHFWLRAPDALQLATAINNGAEVIVTNDEKWSRITEIDVGILKTLVS